MIVLASMAELPPIRVTAPVLSIVAQCTMHSHRQVQYALAATLVPVKADEHRWTLNSPRSPFPTSNPLDFSGQKIDARTYQYLVSKDRERFRYKLRMEYSGFIPGEPKIRNAIMTVSESQQDDSELLVATGICNVETQRQVGT